RFYRFNGGSLMSHSRHFGHGRPSQGGHAPTRQPHPRGNEKFHPLPAPTGAAPFHLNLDAVLPADAINAIKAAGKIVFHMVGDVGGVKDPIPQLLVSKKMEEQLHVAAASRPAFFYIPGDVVYFNGQAEEYYPQFYHPYENYTAPIFAIPGNHDGDP